MENSEKMMTSEESLEVIRAMISKSRVNLSRSSFHLLFWGWLIFACSLSEFFLWRFTDISKAWFVWYLVIPGIFVSLIYGFVKGKREHVFTYATSVFVWTWISFLCAGVVLFIVHSSQLQSFGWYILILAGIPTMISGAVLKFRPLFWGALSFWVVVLVAYFSGEVVRGLAVPTGMITGYLIPGYMLRRKGRRNHVQGA